MFDLADIRSLSHSQARRSRLPPAVRATAGSCRTALLWLKRSHQALSAPAPLTTRQCTRRRTGVRRCPSRRQVVEGRQAVALGQDQAAEAATRLMLRLPAVRSGMTLTIPLAAITATSGSWEGGTNARTVRACRRRTTSARSANYAVIASTTLDMCSSSSTDRCMCRWRVRGLSSHCS